MSVAWVNVSTDVLLGARSAKGLSYEAMGRQLNISAKTWERWEKAGKVRRDMLRQVAGLLDLNVDVGAFRWDVPVSEPDAAAPDLAGLAAVLAEVSDLREQLGRIEQLLLELRGLPRYLTEGAAE